MIFGSTCSAKIVDALGSGLGFRMDSSCRTGLLRTYGIMDWTIT